jgi:exonuclease VII small subunit
VALGDVVPAEEAAILLEDARAALETAIQIYEQQGEGDQVTAARERLDQVTDRINSLRSKRITL